MKTIIAGSRSVTDGRKVYAAIEASGIKITEVVCGCAKGPDAFGQGWATMFGIPTKFFPANWKAHGKAAGPMRNREMGDYAEALIAVWDGKSKGTKHMIDYAKSKGLEVFVVLA